MCAVTGARTGAIPGAAVICFSLKEIPKETTLVITANGIDREYPSRLPRV